MTAAGWIGVAAVGAMLGAALALAAGDAAPADEPGPETKPPARPEIPADAVEALAAEPGFVLAGEAVLIEGEPVALESYLGRAVLVVNVASRCGYTRQYEGLEALYREFKGDGLVVLGFPSNDFGGQEPGSEAEILEFCTARFGVTFPMFEKTPVLGDEAHPLYQKLREQEGPVGAPPTWNFTKYLIGRDGVVLARFGSGDEPGGNKIRAALDEALATPAPGEIPAEVLRAPAPGERPAADA